MSVPIWWRILPVHEIQKSGNQFFLGVREGREKIRRNYFWREMKRVKDEAVKMIARYFIMEY